MTQDLKLQIRLKAIDKVAKPLLGMIQAAEKLRGQMAETDPELKDKVPCQKG